MEGTDARNRDEKGNEVVHDEDAPGMLDPEAQQEEVEEPDPGPPPAQDYGKVVHIKIDGDLTEEQAKLVQDADVVIEDQVTPIITKNREGVAGVVAAPDLVDQAEVIE